MSVTATDFGRVAVLLGGWAAEREVSLVSGRAVLEGLRRRGIDAHGIDAGRDVIDVLGRGGYDRVFNVLHGRGGEDGVIQGALEVLGMPYTGSGVMGSAIAMDKYRTKLVLQALGLPTPGFALIRDEGDLAAAAGLGFPLMIKPVLEGSSIGTAPVHEAEQLLPAWQAARCFGAVFAERFVDGAEYTAGFVGGDVLPLIKLETPNEFYDYEAKYLADDTIYTCPCGLGDEQIARIDRLVLDTIRATGVSDWGRVDLMLDKEQRPWIIEVNTVPGMTDHSLIPMAGRAAGLEMPELVLSILATTLTGDESHVQVP
jgi:D-alanine-D-alanine ligase